MPTFRPPIELATNDRDLTFQAIDWHAEDSEDFDKDLDDAPATVEQRYTIYAFGVTLEGNSLCARISGHTPYFYVEIPDAWNKEHVAKLVASMKKRMMWCHRDAIKGAKIVKRKKMAGFNNNKVFKFVEFSFYTRQAMQHFIRKMEEPVKLPGQNVAITLKAWESNIDPLLRFFHDRDLEPAGWITLLRKTYEIPDFNKTLCQISVETRSHHVVRFENQAVAPLLIASFDIEAGSSHGDFPVARKNYRKLGVDLVAYFYAARMQKTQGGFQTRDLSLRQALDVAFRTDDTEHEISKMHPIKQPTVAQLDSVSRIISAETLIQNLTQLRKQKAEKLGKEKATILHSNETFNDGIERYLQRLIDILDAGLPALRGDPVIQIGTTFTKYGDPSFSYKHVINLGTCDPIPGIEVVACKTEKEVLLAWTKLIQETDPDIVTGEHR